MIEIQKSTKKFVKIKAPSSKAHTLRAFFMAGLGYGRTSVFNPLMGEDQKIALNCLELIGAKVDIKDNLVEIEGVSGNPILKDSYMNCGNSGVSLRFIIPIISLARSGFCVVDGNENMRKRTIEDLINALNKLGVKTEYLGEKGFPPIKIICDGLCGGKTSINGENSSQFLSSLLIAGGCTKQGIELKVEGNLVSKPYVLITIDLMKKFGVSVHNKNFKKFTVSARQFYKLKDIMIEGDYSNASYFFLAAAICKMKVRIDNLVKNSIQGDKIILDILERMGCKIEKQDNYCVVTGKKLKGIEINMQDFPDLVPTIAIAASFADGVTNITNIGHLKHKETNRIYAISNELKKIGINVIHEDDSLTITGGTHKSGIIETYNDHRIAMSFAVVGLVVDKILIKNPDTVAKSYPNFFKVLSEFY